MFSVFTGESLISSFEISVMRQSIVGYKSAIIYVNIYIERYEQNNTHLNKKKMHMT
jgi:hypothetical protein